MVTVALGVDAQSPWDVPAQWGVRSVLYHTLCPIDSSRQKPSSDLTRDQRLALVQGLLNTMPSTYNATIGTFNGTRDATAYEFVLKHLS